MQRILLRYNTQEVKNLSITVTKNKWLYKTPGSSKYVVCLFLDFSPCEEFRIVQRFGWTHHTSSGTDVISRNRHTTWTWAVETNTHIFQVVFRSCLLVLPISYYSLSVTPTSIHNMLYWLWFNAKPNDLSASNEHVTSPM